MRAVSTGRAAWLIIRIRLLRVLNRLQMRRQSASLGTRRVGKPTKEGSRVRAALMAVCFVFLASNAARHLHRNVQETYPPIDGQRPVAALMYLATETALAAMTVLLLALANKELASPEWDLEWLVTFPTRLRPIVAMRVLERTVVNPIGLVLFLSLFTMTAYREGRGWLSPLFGVAVMVPLLAFLAAVQTVVDTSLRVRLPPARLRNLQAVTTVLGTVGLYAIYAPALSDHLPFAWPAQAPRWLLWTPPGLALRSVLADGQPATAWALLVLEALAAVVICVWLVERALADGVVATGGREAARGPRPERAARASGPAGPAAISPVIRRELRLLGRDRTFFVQTLVMPIVIVGFQLFINLQNHRHSGSLRDLAPAHVAAIAFGVASYTLMFSAFQTLNTEGQALWILYTLPRSVIQVLRDKGRLWGAIATGYALTVLTAAALYQGHLPGRQTFTWAIALAGVPIYAVIATSLGVFAARPLAQEAQRRVDPTLTLLYVLMAGLYTYAIYSTSSWQRLALLTITSVLAMASWQKARDRIPFLLDPAAAPANEVSLADGMMTALLFFVLQGLAGMILIATKEPIGARTTLLAFAVAGAVAAAGSWLVHRLTAARGRPRLWGAGGGRAVLTGLVGGAIAAAAGVTYLLVLASLKGRFPGLIPKSETVLALRNPGPWIFILAVVAAPLFEEYIFRGLVFGGMRRSWRLSTAALTSALIFGVVHPALSVAPVFVMGAIAALVYDRRKLLIAPMVTHAVYNAVVYFVGEALLRSG